MKFSQRVACATLFCCASTCISAYADTRPDSHAPIGVMGDHVHNKGEWMFSYRFMTMSMEGNRDGTSSISPSEIVTQVPNRFANPPVMPPTLRVVPLSMDMDMHMFGAMYAPTDSLTLMAMVNYVEKEMEHVTFGGAMGTNPIGRFTTETKGLGDTQIAGLIKFYEQGSHRIHATLGLSLPTGSTDETDQILTPMNTRPSPRLPYPMQLGSGTYDVISGLTYAGHSGLWGWGSQWRSTLRTGENDEGYQLGDEHTLQAWMSYQVHHAVSVSLRTQYFRRDNISGIDPRIAAPVQTADPDRQKLNRWDVGVGANFVLDDRHRLAFEVTTPITQDLDGPQLETDWQMTLAWQFVP